MKDLASRFNSLFSEYKPVAWRTLIDKWNRFEKYADRVLIQKHSENDGEFEEEIDADVKLYMEMNENEASNEGMTKRGEREKNRSIQNDLTGNMQPLHGSVNRSQVANENRDDANENQNGLDLTSTMTPNMNIIRHENPNKRRRGTREQPQLNDPHDHLKTIFSKIDDNNDSDLNLTSLIDNYATFTKIGNEMSLDAIKIKENLEKLILNSTEDLLSNQKKTRRNNHASLTSSPDSLSSLLNLNRRLLGDTHSNGNQNNNGNTD